MNHALGLLRKYWKYWYKLYIGGIGALFVANYRKSAINRKQKISKTGIHAIEIGTPRMRTKPALDESVLLNY